LARKGEGLSRGGEEKGEGGVVVRARKPVREKIKRDVGGSFLNPSRIGKGHLFC